MESIESIEYDAKLRELLAQMESMDHQELDSDEEVEREPIDYAAKVQELLALDSEEALERELELHSDEVVERFQLELDAELLKTSANLAATQYRIMVTLSERELEDQRECLQEIDERANNPKVTALLAQVEEEVVQIHRARVAEALASVLQRNDDVPSHGFEDVIEELILKEVNDGQANNPEQELVQSNSNQSTEAPLSTLQQDEITATESPASLEDQLTHGMEIDTNNERSGLGSETS